MILVVDYLAWLLLDFKSNILQNIQLTERLFSVGTWSENSLALQIVNRRLPHIQPRGGNEGTLPGHCCCKIFITAGHFGNALRVLS